MIFRTLLLWLRRNRGPRVGIHDVGRLPMRVWPSDCDTLNHVNNGVYLSLMDLGRFDLLHRSGAWDVMQKHRFYPVIASETITFRRSLQPWQKYVLESKIIGYDAKAVYLEQRFVVEGEIYAQGIVRGRFLKKGGGTVSLDELSAALGIDVTQQVIPPWVERWAADVALPPARGSAPSVWE